jgi:large subunit ribosomal protein L21
MVKYAIAEISGTQFWIEEGMEITLDRIKRPVGTFLNLERILLFNDNHEFNMGRPYIKNIKVLAQITGHYKTKKIKIFKMKANKKYRIQKNARQMKTKIFIHKFIV